MSYLRAHPGFRQKISGRMYLIKWMHDTLEGARECIKKVKKTGRYNEVILYLRVINGKLFGRHPYCVAVRGRK